MEKQYFEASYADVRDVIMSLPAAIANAVSCSILTDDLLILDHFSGDTICASYYSDTGLIILHGFTQLGIDNFDYADVLLHEIGHKIFVEKLTYEQHWNWEEIRQFEEFPVELDDIYMVTSLKEEEFCIVLSLIYFDVFLRRRGLEREALKVKEALQKMPRRTEIIKLAIGDLAEDCQRKAKKTDRCYKRVHERVREFVFGRI